MAAIARELEMVSTGEQSCSAVAPQDTSTDDRGRIGGRIDRGRTPVGGCQLCHLCYRFGTQLHPLLIRCRAQLFIGWWHRTFLTQYVRSVSVVFAFRCASSSGSRVSSQRPDSCTTVHRIINNVRCLSSLTHRRFISRDSVDDHTIQSKKRVPDRRCRTC